MSEQNIIDKNENWSDLTVFFRNVALRVLEKCRIERTFRISGKEETLSLLVPSGDMKYGAFWVRDAAMMAESGLVPPGELLGWVRLVASEGQNGGTGTELENSLFVPPWSVADHIGFHGGASYYPGTMSAGKNQGSGGNGFYPPHDDRYYFIEMGHLYYQASGDAGFLSEEIDGVALLSRFENAFDADGIDAQTQLCVSDYPRYTVDWGFCDTIVKSGALLFPSLLRYRAALRLAGLCAAAGETRKAENYLKTAAIVRENIMMTFYSNGWFLSATGIGRQKDVWGTAFALWLGVAGDAETKKAAENLLAAYLDGSAVSRGYVRHIPSGEDTSPASAWEMTSCPYQTYQNGGYWATPSGWYLYAISLADRFAAHRMAAELADDIRNYESAGAPFEWRSADAKEKSGLFYGASAALPYAGVLRTAARSKL